MKKNLVLAYIFITLLSYIIIAGGGVYLILDRGNLKDDLKAKEDEVTTLKEKVDSLSNDLEMIKEENGIDSSKGYGVVGQPVEGSKSVSEMSDEELIAAIREYYIANKTSAAKDYTISISGKSGAYVSAIVGSSPALLQFSEGKVIKIVFNRNDAATCAEVDGLGVQSLIAKCLDADGEIRDTK